MRRLLIPALLLLLAVTPLAAADLDRVRAADIQGRCSDGKPRAVLVVDGDAADDCANGGSTTEVLCCCLDGDWAACSSGTGGSGDITDVWGCTSGNCNAITGASGDSLDAGSADSSRPGTRSTSLPSDCYEGQVHQDTDSGGSETYICTVGDGPGGSADTWTKLSTTATVESDDVAPYGQYDPDNPPATCAICDEFTNDTETQTWTCAGNTDATKTDVLDSMRVVVTGDSTAVDRYICTVAAPSGSFVMSAKIQASFYPSGIPMCGLVVIRTGTQSAPTSLVQLINYFLTTNKFVVTQTATSMTGATSNVGGGWTYLTCGGCEAAIYMQIRYDATADTLTYCAGYDGFKTLGCAEQSSVTADPLYVGILADDLANNGSIPAADCFFEFVRIRTDATGTTDPFPIGE